MGSDRKRPYVCNGEFAGGMGCGRFRQSDKGAAKALLGKAYMQQHKYDRAKEQLQWLIDREGSLYGLLDNREDNFTDLNENNQEGIFEIQFDDQIRGHRQ